MASDSNRMHNSNEIVTNIGLQIATLNVVFNVFKFFNVNVHSEIGITPHGVTARLTARLLTQF